MNCTFYLGFPSVNLGINKRIFCKGYDLHIASLSYIFIKISSQKVISIQYIFNSDKATNYPVVIT